MSHYNFKGITHVQNKQEFVDCLLSKTQRKTATVVHKHYPIGRIRRFYATKIKFTQQTAHDKLTTILTEFPKVDDLHPFYSTLIGVIVDKDHYKVALADLNRARYLIDKHASHHVTLLKYAESLQRAKCLKVAALGKIVKIMKNKKRAEALIYLEEVRQKLARMPSIDPNAPTIILCGVPNVGKSSFMNKVTRADVEVQPYAFTTKSLYVGHLDYESIRYQVIDTPGLLDRPIEERNTCEMQAVAALAHLRACFLYIMDMSEMCNYTFAQQINLFNDTVKPMARLNKERKPVIIALNKADVLRRSNLRQDQQDVLNQLEAEFGNILEMSTVNDDVTEVKLKACSSLLQYRIEKKLQTANVDKLMNRIYVAMPMKKDQKDRPACIPPPRTTENKKKLERDIELEEGDEYTLDLHKNYLLQKSEEKYDIMPEIWRGKNIADFVDPNLDEKMAKLKMMEDTRKHSGYYDPSSEEDEDEMETRLMAEEIRDKQKMKSIVSREKRRVQAPRMPRTSKKLDKGDVESSLEKQGLKLDMKEAHFGRSRSRSVVSKQLKRKREESTDVRADKKRRDDSAVSRSRSRARSSSRVPRDKSGVRDEKMATKAKKLANISQRKMNLNSKKGEADRRVLISKPKHLFSGKRKMGKNDRR